MPPTRDWVSFWDSAHPIYVNARHLDVHYRRIAEDIVELLPARGARVLDFGCGEALHARKIAAVAWELYLVEAAPKLRARLKQRLAREPKVRVLAPDDLERMAGASLDLVVVNSVVQYLSRADFERLLQLFKKRLRMGGQLIVADVVAPHQSALADALSLLRFAARNGFFLAALRGLVRTVFSPYRSLRARLGLSQYSESEMLDVLRAAGFNAERMQPNLGHNQARMAFRATKIGEMALRT
jgi:SAM-dependent methyltransferase